MTAHKIKTRTYLGFGKWDECKICGATKHSGEWWLGGYVSKTKPDCDMGDDQFKKWADTGNKIDLDELQK